MVWLTGQPIPGVDEAVARLRGVGVRVLFATNNAPPTRAELHTQLAHCGITADDARPARSADVAAGMLDPGTTAVVLGRATASLEALAARGVTVVPEGPADAVVVGLTRAFTYDAVAAAATAIRGGARLIGTNTDATYPTPDGLVPGAGVDPGGRRDGRRGHAGGGGQAAPPDRRGHLARMVPAGSSGSWWGTVRSTDGALAAQLGIPFALVLSGVTRRGDVPDRRRRRCGGAGLAPAGPPGPRRRLKKCLQLASTSDTLVEWQAMSAYANTSMRGRSSDRSAVAGPRRSCESW